jgi:DNA-binding transcriptional ArsR family regulator
LHLDNVKIIFYNKIILYNDHHLMQDVLYIEQAEQALPLLKPLRAEILQQLAEPRTCLDLAEIFESTPQKIYYHIKELEKAGLVKKVSETRVRGVVEGHYQAKARSYWLSPKLVGQIGSPRQAQDQASLRVLLSLAEDIHRDVGKLGERSATGQTIPSLSLDASIYLPSGDRRVEFLGEVQNLFQTLAEKYSLPADDPLPGETFRLVLACYPKE